jgi:adenylylsulfate kinase
MDVQQPSGFVIWLTGMAGAGKTTLANQIVKRFAAVSRHVEMLDGDAPAEILTRGLGVSKDDRDMAVRRLGAVARMLVRHGAGVVVASLSPFREARDLVRRDVRRFVEVFVDAPMETLQARDSEGLYKRALAHELTNVAGIDDPYEPPAHPELVIRSDQEKPDVASMRVFQKLADMKLIPSAEFIRLSGGMRPRRGSAAPEAARARPGAAPAKADKAGKASKAGAVAGAGKAAKAAKGGKAVARPAAPAAGKKASRAAKGSRK